MTKRRSNKTSNATNADATGGQPTGSVPPYKDDTNEACVTT
jgi:hypothetical protein